jgi:hypothetical protein
VAGDIEITGTVQGDAIAAGGRVTLFPGASVEGEAVAVGGVVTHAGAVVKGGVESIPYVHLPGQRSLHPLGVLTFLGVNGAAALIGGLILRSRRCTNLADSILRHPLSTMVAGVLVFALWSLLWIFDDEWPSWALMAAWVVHGVVLVLLVCGCSGISWLAGRLVLPRLPSYVRLLAGAFMVSVGLLVPVAGTLVLLAATILAFGASIVSALGTDPFWIGRRRKTFEAGAPELEP